MAGGMAGKLCVVTGSNTGIGRVIAEGEFDVNIWEGV